MLLDLAPLVIRSPFHIIDAMSSDISPAPSYDLSLQHRRGCEKGALAYSETVAVALNIIYFLDAILCDLNRRTRCRKCLYSLY